MVLEEVGGLVAEVRAVSSELAAPAGLAMFGHPAQLVRDSAQAVGGFVLLLVGLFDELVACPVGHLPSLLADVRRHLGRLLLCRAGYLANGFSRCVFQVRRFRIGGTCHPVGLARLTCGAGPVICGGRHERLLPEMIEAPR
jgi:hypothetical protein